MDKFSELKAAAMAATPGPWFRSSVQFNGITTEATFITQGNKPHVASTSEKRDAIFIAAANPAVVLELLAELEAKDKRCGALERINQAQDDHINQQQDRIESLEKKNGDLGQGLQAAEKRIAGLVARLATPVRLPTTSGRLGVAYTRVLPEVIEAIRAAGFKVAGDEQ